MSRYVRDDKQFRAQMAKLADAGLTFPTDPTPRPQPQTPRNSRASALVAGLVFWLLTGAGVGALLWAFVWVLGRII
jgi:hypothetical protein